MKTIKPYKKEKEGKLQRLPVKHVNGYHVHNEDQDFITLNPKTKVIIHHGTFDEIPLEMVKKARMVTNPFIKAMRENAEKND